MRSILSRSQIWLRSQKTVGSPLAVWTPRVEKSTLMSEPTTAQSIRLTDQQTLHDTMLMGQRHIPLHANGYSCQTADVWRIVLAAAARRTTIEAACADLERTPDANTVRGYLTAQLSAAEIPDKERQWNELFRTLLPAWLA